MVPASRGVPGRGLPVSRATCTVRTRGSGSMATKANSTPSSRSFMQPDSRPHRQLHGAGAGAGVFYFLFRREDRPHHTSPPARLVSDFLEDEDYGQLLQRMTSIIDVGALQATRRGQERLVQVGPVTDRLDVPGPSAGRLVSRHSFSVFFGSLSPSGLCLDFFFRSCWPSPITSLYQVRVVLIAIATPLSMQLCKLWRVLPSRTTGSFAVRAELSIYPWCLLLETCLCTPPPIRNLLACRHR